MKKVLIGLVALGSFSIFAETITIVKPLINVEATTTGQMTYSKTLETTGAFSMTFGTKEECMKWAGDSVKVLKAQNKAVFSANCSNDDDFRGGERRDGSYTGSVSYL